MWNRALRCHVSVKLQIAGSTEAVTVEAQGGDLLENDPTFHTDVDKNLFDKLPLESQSSSVSSLITLSTPGITADSNGLFHGMGDHAENSFSVDGQPITDQQSKIFSNQIPLDAIQSMEVIAGAPPAEYGDKTSVVINVTTQSGQGVTTPHGSLTTSYGSFGTSNVDFNLAYGGKKWGNFVSASGLNSGRFLDPPEFAVIHDKGNEENLFDRVDYQLSNADSIHLNLGYTRSWFQTPNTFDSQNATAWNGVVVNDRGLDSSRKNGGPGRPAIANQHVQPCTFVDAPDQFDRCVHAGRFRAARSVQLLSQRQSVRRSGADESAARDRGTKSRAPERRSAFGSVVRQRNSQSESGSGLSADVPG
jgi:hypothetical protein